MRPRSLVHPLPLSHSSRNLCVPAVSGLVEGSDHVLQAPEPHTPPLTFSVKPPHEDLPGKHSRESPTETHTVPRRATITAYLGLLFQVHGPKVLQACPEEGGHPRKEGSSATCTNPSDSVTVTVTSGGKKKKEVPWGCFCETQEDHLNSRAGHGADGALTAGPQPVLAAGSFVKSGGRQLQRGCWRAVSYLF